MLFNKLKIIGSYLPIELMEKNTEISFLMFHNKWIVKSVSLIPRKKKKVKNGNTTNNNYLQINKLKYSS